MKHPKVANIGANHFTIHTTKGVYLQSYASLIAFIDNKGKVYLDENKWDYSQTTGRYRNDFLNERIAETRLRIQSKEYKLIDLNN